MEFKEHQDVHGNNKVDKSTDPFNMGVTVPLGQTTKEDQEMFKKYCYNKDLVVELGTFWGRSAAIMSLFAKRVVTIDSFLGEPHDYKKTCKDLKEFKNVQVIRGEAYYQAADFDNKSVDVLFIDAGHLYREVFRDFYSWFSKVKVGGHIMFHDYTLQESVKEAVTDIIAQETRFVEEGEHYGWIKVLKRVA